MLLPQFHTQLVCRSFKFLNGSLSLMMVNSNRTLRSLQSLSDSIISKPTVTRQSEKESKQLCDAYYLADKETREKLLRHIGSQYCTSSAHAVNSTKIFMNTKDREEDQDGLMAVDKLRATLNPKYMNLFNQVARLEDGVKFIVDIRSDLLHAISSSPLDKSSKIQLRSLSEHIKELLSLWFSVGFLMSERMTWNSPTSMLQKISDYEAIHPMRSWTDLKRRVGPYRRCFVFTHSCLPREPLVILHVALLGSISSSIQEIIKRTQVTTPNPDFYAISPTHDEETLASMDLYATKEDPNQISTAIFYSISSTQKGLHGIELGNQLIKRVVREIKSEFPQITQFSSLSPIPNFNEYLLVELQAIQSGDESKSFCTPDELSLLKKHLMETNPQENDMWVVLMRHLKHNTWIYDDKLTQLLHGPLMRKCAHYLYNEKRRGYSLNSVAHFHLRNGAVMWRLNWLADMSQRGLSNSSGMMVNYRYFLENTENNSHLYTEEKFIVASDQFLNLIKPIRSSL